MDDLDTLFKQASGPTQVPDALMARVLADAAREQPIAQPFGTHKRAKPRFWAGLADLFGGGGVLAGLASVACAGIYLGAVQPSVIGDFSAVLTGGLVVEQLDYMPSIDAILAQE